MPRYLIPRNPNAAGIAELCRRLAALIKCVETQINAGLVAGDIIKHLHEFETGMLTNLENEGWTFSYEAGPKLKVRPPGHPHPFATRYTNIKGTRREP